MAIKYYKPTTNGRRNMTTLINTENHWEFEAELILSCFYIMLPPKQ